MVPRVRTEHPAGGAQPVAIDTATMRLHQALAQVEVLRLVLASSRQESIAARQQVELLTETNARLREISVRQEKEVATARHFAHHDELTGLPNRTLLLDRLNQALVRAERQRKPLALFFLDLDRFKDVNDRLGHAAGDQLLRRVAGRLLACIRGGDTACRYGGDEFVLLLPEVDDERHALEVARKIGARLATAHVIDEDSIVVTASIGVAVYPVDGTSQHDLIRQADVAMYLAKTLRGSSNARAGIVAAR